MIRLRTARQLATFILSGALVVSCSTRSDSSADTSAANAVGAPDTSSSHAGMSGMADMTGDPDRDFLRMMSDHHKGLIAMVHPTMESKENLSVKGDASKLDKKQDAELEQMISILDKQYKDPYTPKVTPDAQQMVDDLKGKSGADYSRTFLNHVIMHHQQAVKMIDDYLPQAKNPEAKSMAAKMKADQTKEIAEFQRKLSAL